MASAKACSKKVTSASTLKGPNHPKCHHVLEKLPKGVAITNDLYALIKSKEAAMRFKELSNGVGSEGGYREATFGMVTISPEGVGCYGDNITWGCKNLEERVDKENME
ncbi:hypothetical protein HAX54_008003 [Datura stramonium]|uniref:Uncharacterized protein n=1 Tax=Datura stramonium TaxID=4076 RepID=A0ABS8TE13_DATST|nr:hypothetical protein [Datura stramonium]